MSGSRVTGGSRGAVLGGSARVLIRCLGLLITFSEGRRGGGVGEREVDFLYFICRNRRDGKIGAEKNRYMEMRSSTR